jgi:hypothetical protein
MNYFKKELLKSGRPVVTDKGWPIQFEDDGLGNGIIATNDPYTIGQLTKLAEASRLGVSQITEAEYSDLKKKAPSHQQRTSPAWSQSPVRLETEARAASPVGTATNHIDHSLPKQIPTGKALEIPEVPAPAAPPADPAPKKVNRRPSATKASKATSTLEATPEPQQDPV